MANKTVAHEDDALELEIQSKCTIQILKPVKSDIYETHYYFDEKFVGKNN